MLHPSTKKLIDRLTEMTERGKLNWAEAENNAVTYVTEGYSVSLTAEPNELVIISSEGKELERATVEQLAATASETGATYTAIIAALTQEASRIARGTESAISSLLAGIDIDDQPLPETPETHGLETQPPPDDAGDTDAQVEDIADETDAAASEAPEPLAQTEEQAATSAETETPDETEPDMTEAVARLAEEVNGRTEDASAIEESSDTVTGTLAAAAAGGLAVAAATQDGDETVVKATSDSDENSDAATTGADAAKYVPFGLETTDEVDAESSAEETAETETPATETPELAASEPENELEQFAPAAIAAVTEMTEAASEEIPEQEVAETAPAGPDNQTQPTADRPESSALPETETETETAAAASDATETFDTAEAVTETTPETLTDTEEPTQTEPAPEPEQRSYSLSGIGAGFGFGALTATTEATGVPSANSSPEPEEKIIIDATDDMPLTPPEDSSDAGSKDDLPDIAALEQPQETPPAEAPSDAPEAEMAEDGDTALKPRTRFNPWN